MIHLWSMVRIALHRSLAVYSQIVDSNKCICRTQWHSSIYLNSQGRSNFSHRQHWPPMQMEWAAADTPAWMARRNCGILSCGQVVHILRLAADTPAWMACRNCGILSCWKELRQIILRAGSAYSSTCCRYSGINGTQELWHIILLAGIVANYLVGR